MKNSLYFKKQTIPHGCFGFKKDWQTYLKKGKSENGKFMPLIFNQYLAKQLSHAQVIQV